MYELNLSPLLDSVKRSPVVSPTTVRSKQRVLRALLSPLLAFISGDMFVTTPTLVMGTDQFPKTWVFEQFTTIKFSGANSRIRMWRFSDFSLKQIVLVLSAHPEDGDGVISRNVGKRRLTRLSGRENFIEFCRRESFKTYIKTRYDEGGGRLQDKTW